MFENMAFPQEYYWFGVKVFAPLLLVCVVTLVVLWWVNRDPKEK